MQRDPERTGGVCVWGVFDQKRDCSDCMFLGAFVKFRKTTTNFVIRIEQIGSYVMTFFI
jgi:hypothetical protein